MTQLDGKVALVTGASRGIGRGVALALGSAGATVFVTGRSRAPVGDRPGHVASHASDPNLPGTIDATAADVTARGGRGVAVPCDHARDADVAAVVERIRSEAGRLDILVNNVFALPSGPLFDTPFWEQPIAVWDTMHGVGLRSHYVATALAAPLMIDSGPGLVANISSFGGAGFQVNVAYGVGKAAVDRLAADMAHDLAPHAITCVSLWPGIVKTERMLALADQLPWDVAGGESPELTGRAVVALAADPEVARHSGAVLVVAELAAAYGFTDIDGTTPRSLRRARTVDAGGDGRDR